MAMVLAMRCGAAIWAIDFEMRARGCCFFVQAGPFHFNPSHPLSHPTQPTQQYPQEKTRT